MSAKKDDMGAVDVAVDAGLEDTGGVKVDAVPSGDLLVVIEPPVEGGRAAGARRVAGLGEVEKPSATGVPGTTGTPGLVLLREGARLAADLGVGVQAVTWGEHQEVAPEMLADALGRRAAQIQASAVLFADSDMSRHVAPLLAHRLGSAAVLGCSDALVSDRPAGAGALQKQRRLCFVKPVYGGWLEQEVEPALGTIPVVTLELAGMGLTETGAPHLPVPQVLEVRGVGVAAAGTVRRLELIPPDPSRVDLVHARRIVTAGSGSASEELLTAVGELAALLQGSVAATRPVVDDGLLPKERLIGQTGRTVSPDLYIALGVSGSPHHLAGVRSAGRVLAVNHDTRAPIFQFSDEGYVADLRVILPGLVRKIKEWRDASGSLDGS